jgi:succinate dehydrogenase / fumarate reductase flavoprotein subunit
MRAQEYPGSDIVIQSELERDDKNWLKHSLWFKEGNRVAYKPVHLKPLSVESFEPKVRTY